MNNNEVNTDPIQDTFTDADGETYNTGGAAAWAMIGAVFFILSVLCGVMYNIGLFDLLVK